MRKSSTDCLKSRMMLITLLQGCGWPWHAFALSSSHPWRATGLLLRPPCATRVTVQAVQPPPNPTENPLVTPLPLMLRLAQSLLSPKRPPQTMSSKSPTPRRRGMWRARIHRQRRLHRRMLQSRRRRSSSLLLVWTQTLRRDLTQELQLQERRWISGPRSLLPCRDSTDCRSKRSRRTCLWPARRARPAPMMSSADQHKSPNQTFNLRTSSSPRTLRSRAWGQNKVLLVLSVLSAGLMKSSDSLHVMGTTNTEGV
mmetsp:Transcript_119675/g.211520  ORF Transcript_119675/g.211520 Transcript_119675/m.211520 type:complete len:255 (+) Transcript_119675:1053-1817(+)